MKRLLTTVAAATAIVGYAATYEENLELSQTSIDKITTANAEAVCNAAAAVTNARKIVQCRDKGLLTFEQTAAYFAGKEEFAWALYWNAEASSNATLRAACVDSLLASAKVAPDNVFASSCWFGNALANFKVSPSRRIEVCRELIAAGKLVQAIYPIYQGLGNSFFKGNSQPNLPEYGDEYRAFCAEVFDQLYAAWIAAEPRVQKNGRLYNAWNEGLSIISYASAINSPRFSDSAAIAKVCKYVSDGQLVWIGHGHQPMHNACRAAALASKYLSEDMKLKIAANSDKVFKNKNTTNALYLELKDSANKVKVALYLNDTDKLIDSCLDMPINCTAEDIGKIVIILNGLNADYRSADVMKTLKNINAKYTLKLYDDRDTWEPILSKVRALIDAR